MKKILVVSDMHTGHKLGLNPPALWANKQYPELRSIQKKHFNWYKSKIASEGPFDICFVMGDCIDGKNIKSGNREEMEQDRFDQCESAIALLQLVNASRYVMVEGSGYHTGKEEQFERFIAKELQSVPLKERRFVDVEGVKFALRHKTGRSSVWHGRNTSIAKQKVNNRLQAVRAREPEVDVMLFGHVHYHTYCGQKGNNAWLAMTCPALQINSGFGELECEGETHVGLVTFSVEKGKFDWNMHENPIIRPSEIIKL